MTDRSWLACACIGTSLLLLTACIGGEEDTGDGLVDPYSGDMTIHRNIDAYGALVLFASDHPGSTSDRTPFTTSLSVDNDLFWTLEARVVEPDLRDISLSVDFDTFGGCYFTGDTNPFQGQLHEGSCVFPTETGHVYFQLTESAIYQTANIFGVGTTTLRGRWMEEQNGALLTGDGTLYLRQHDQNSAIGNSAFVDAPHVADYRDPFTQGGSCLHAGLYGTGTLVEGDASQCAGGALEMGGSGFDLYIDEGARLSFVPLTDNEPDQRIQGVVSADGSALMAFTGNIAGLNTRYDIEHDTGRIAFTNTFFWTPGEGSSVLCTVQWSGPTETCAR